MRLRLDARPELEPREWPILSLCCFTRLATPAPGHNSGSIAWLPLHTIGTMVCSCQSKPALLCTNTCITKHSVADKWSEKTVLDYLNPAFQTADWPRGDFRSPPNLLPQLPFTCQCSTRRRPTDSRSGNRILAFHFYSTSIEQYSAHTDETTPLYVTLVDYPMGARVTPH